MTSPVSTWTAQDNATQVRDTFNQNTTRRHWRAVTEIDNTDSPYTVVDGDELIRADATSGAITIALPAAASNVGRVLWVEAVNVSNTITLDGNGAETINGSATKTIGTAGRLVVLYCDGVDWTAWYRDRLP